MGSSIHRRDTKKGPVYREWSSIVDAYTSDVMTREGMIGYLLAEKGYPHDKDVRARALAEIEERLARCDAQGTSLRGQRRKTTSWDTECCARCGSFHHKYSTGHKANCKRCGEPESDVGHQPPCTGP